MDSSAHSAPFPACGTPACSFLKALHGSMLSNCTTGQPGGAARRQSKPECAAGNPCACPTGREAAPAASGNHCGSNAKLLQEASPTTELSARSSLGALCASMRTLSARQHPAGGLHAVAHHCKHDCVSIESLCEASGPAKGHCAVSSGCIVHFDGNAICTDAAAQSGPLCEHAVAASLTELYVSL